MSDYLLFSLNSVRYGIDANAVREIFWLPELSLIEEAPSYIVGVINLRGQILPIMSLDERFNRSQKQVLLTDKVIVLQFAETTLGILVSEVHGVDAIAQADIEPMPRFNNNEKTAHFIAAEAKINDSIWMLLDLANLIDAPDFQQQSHDDLNSLDLFCQKTKQDRNIFQARAKQLAISDDNEITTKQQAFAVIQLSNECYAIAMDEVREFCHLGQYTPIPCCPSHIMGNMNLRGDILTLVDVRPVLSLNINDDLSEVMVVESNELRVGIPVSEVLDVIYLLPAEHLALPVSAHEAHQEYCTGAMHYRSSIASILDIKMLLTKGGLEVNEDV